VGFGCSTFEPEVTAMLASVAKFLPPKCVSVHEAAELLGVVPLTIRRLIKNGKLRAVHVGRRVMIRVCDLEAFLADNEVQP
jgi:excisionase family DNA binding protein